MTNVPMVFVGSTREDLLPERKAILCAISRQSLPHNSMETFGASPRPPIEKCLERVAQCDVMVLVIGHRYGCVPEGSEQSYTQQEYEYAKQEGRKILAYIKSDDCLVHPKHVERDTQNNKRLETFKATLCAESTVSYFRNELELAVQVAIDLAGVTKELESPESTSSVGRKKQAEKKKAAENEAVAIRCVDNALANRLKDACGELTPPPQVVDKLDRLDQFGIVIIVGSGYRKRLTLSREEKQNVLEFVAGGGGLLCVGQAWSWVYRKYGNMPVEMYPLNVIGRELGFLVSGKNIGKPDENTTDKGVFGSTRWQGREKWPPSEILSRKSGVEPVVKDENARSMGVKGEYGDGRFVVLGHEGMLVYNPEIVPKVVRFLRSGDLREGENG